MKIRHPVTPRHPVMYGRGRERCHKPDVSETVVWCACDTKHGLIRTGMYGGGRETCHEGARRVTTWCWERGSRMVHLVYTSHSKCIYIYIHTHTYIHIYVYIYIYIHIYIFIYYIQTILNNNALAGKRDVSRPDVEKGGHELYNDTRVFNKDVLAGERDVSTREGDVCSTMMYWREKETCQREKETSYNWCWERWSRMVYIVQTSNELYWTMMYWWETETSHNLILKEVSRIVHIIYTSHELYLTLIHGWDKDFSGEKETTCDHIIHTSHELYSTIIYGWEKDFSGEKETACSLTCRKVVPIYAHYIYIYMMCNLCKLYICEEFVHIVENNVQLLHIMCTLCAHYIYIMCNLCTLYINNA